MMEAINKHEGPALAQRLESGTRPRTFTQEEVNKIVSERLSKERAKAAAADQSQETPLSQQTAALTAWENRLACLSYLRERGVRVELLDILDTADVQKFQQQTDRLLELCPSLDEHSAPPPTFSLETHGRRDEFSQDPFAAAFGRI